MTTEILNKKIELTEAAIDLYMQDDFTISRLADKTGETASQIYTLFPNKKAILKFYYPSLILRYRAMITEIGDFDSYTLSEKLSNFMFTLFDMMEERMKFVEATFADYEWSCSSKTEFQKEIKILFKDFIESDERIASSASFFIGELFYASLKSHYLYVIKFWLDDDSENRERTFALIDKVTGFIEELLYSKIADKGFDLAKYTLSAFGFDQQIKDFNEWVSSWFDNTYAEDEEVDIEIDDDEDTEDTTNE